MLAPAPATILELLKPVTWLQIVVIGLLAHGQRPWHALIVAALLAGQGALMWRLLKDPRKYAIWYNATGTTLYVLGMLATAFALRNLPGNLP